MPGNPQERPRREVAHHELRLRQLVDVGHAHAEDDVAAKRSQMRDECVREALRGSRRDYTQGPIGRAILVLAVPMVLEMVMESVFAVCDVFFVSRLGADAVATVGLTESMLTIIYSIAMGLAIGATAMVARRTGEKNPECAAHVAAQYHLNGGKPLVKVLVRDPAASPNPIRDVAIARTLDPTQRSDVLVPVSVIPSGCL